MRRQQEKTGAGLGVKARFHLGLALICLCFCVLVTALLYFYKKQSLEEETYRRTELVVAAVEATREYVRDVLRPRMYEVLRDQDETFVIEAMSTSYVSRVVMDRFKEKLPAFEYRRVAVNARNPAYEANELERRMIRYFQEHPAESRWHGIHEAGGRQYYMTFIPVRYDNSCLRCHGEVEDAPAEIVLQYGPDKGFFNDPGMVGGVQSVAIPIDFGLEKIMDVAWSVFFAAALAVFALYGIIYLFFNRVVVTNLRELLDIFRDNLRDGHGSYLYEQARSKDEIEEMAAAVKGVAAHLRTSRRKLEDYAENLERKVAERTRALRDSEARLRRKVVERGQELRALNTIAELITRAAPLGEMLPRVLQQALKVIPAKGAGIYLLDRGRAELRLRCHENGEALEERIPFDGGRCLPLLESEALDFDGFIHQAACSSSSALGSEPALARNVNVPLCCRGQVLGVMTFLMSEEMTVDDQQNELLSSIGHQVGITVESLENIARLVQGKELLQSVFDGITDVVMLLDRHRRVKMVNRAFLERHQVRLADVLGKRLEQVDLKGPCPFMRCHGALTSRGERAAVEAVEIDGRHYEVSIYPIRYDEGEGDDIVCYAKDMTEQKQVERRIQQTEKLVALGQLAAGVAHEINNPLGIILCYTDILRQDLPGGAAPHLEDIDIIEKHARNCQRIVADLLNFARSRQGHKSPSSIVPVIRGVVSMLGQQFRKRGICFDLSLSEPGPDVLLDRDRMGQVFVNLFMNAAQAIDRDGTIRVVSKMSPSGSHLQIIVEDDGHGIAAAHLSKIFDPFFTTKPQGMGTGLGLSVTYGIIKDHDGEIMVESACREWTRFTLTLPLAATGEEEQADDTAADSDR